MRPLNDPINLTTGDYLEIGALNDSDDPLSLDYDVAMRMYECKKHEVTEEMLFRAQVELYGGTKEEFLPDHIIELFKSKKVQ